MKLKNAYAVYIDFDGDICSETGTHIFAGEEALDEVRDLIRTALTDMDRYSILNRGYHPYAYIDIGCDDPVPVSEIIVNNQFLDAFIDSGGSSFGNWDIEIYKSEDVNL